MKILGYAVVGLAWLVIVGIAIREYRSWRADRRAHQVQLERLCERDLLRRVS